MDLKDFYDEIKANLKERFDKEGKETIVWVWKELSGVKGFYGNGIINNAVVIWITHRPSLPVEKFPDWIDKIFYTVLKEEGFENMHFTDFVKVAGKGGEDPSEEVVKISAEWMKKEIDILKVDGKKLIIVANTRDVEAWMKEYLPEHDCEYRKFFKIVIRFNKKENREHLLRQTLKQIYEMTK